MNITPYLIAIVGIALIVEQEYVIAATMLLIAISEITLPNLNTITTTSATFIRFGLIGALVSLLVYRFLT
ncbi:MULTISPECIES: hypothetical protein [unclassified Nostoc]|uniref:hypothetical protein n=1 Tax=unclassified Nostoc TaxID=2593658 RepID=UPI0015C31B72|nr:hypothetical protein [Nostoc sp. C052]QLE42552.1 hypothetical protein FD723_20365 [Nostoc sp. C052]